MPEGTRALLAELAGVGRDHPLSIEKLCPVLAYYEVDDWREGCERCTQILRYGGLGHTMSIHSRNDQVILEFGLRKPAYRICVNTPTTHGSIGLTTGLDPAMTLGCGGFGGNITSDNITPRHLLNVKRVAYELRPRTRAAGAPRRHRAGGGAARAEPGAAARAAAAAGGADSGRAARRGHRPLARRARGPGAAVRARRRRRPPRPPRRSSARTTCAGPRTPGGALFAGPRTIVTPAARDAAAASDVLVWLDGSSR